MPPKTVIFKRKILSDMLTTFALLLAPTINQNLCIWRHAIKYNQTIRAKIKIMAPVTLKMHRSKHYDALKNLEGSIKNNYLECVWLCVLLKINAITYIFVFKV